MYIVKLDSQDITILYLHVNWEGLSEGNIIIRGPMQARFGVTTKPCCFNDSAITILLQKIRNI